MILSYTLSLYGLTVRQLKRNLSWVKTAWGRSASIYSLLFYYYWLQLEYIISFRNEVNLIVKRMHGVKQLKNGMEQHATANPKQRMEWAALTLARMELFVGLRAMRREMREWNVMEWLALSPRPAFHLFSFVILPQSINFTCRCGPFSFLFNHFHCCVRAIQMMKEMEWFACGYILLHQHPSSQSTKYLFDFDLRLFPQHRYTYCYNNMFMLH